MRALPCLLALLCAAPAFAQEEEAPSEETEATVRPGSDTADLVRPRRYEGPRRRAQAFLVPMDEGARSPTTRVAQAIESVLSGTTMYEVVDLGRALTVESTAEQARSAGEGRRLIAEGDAAAAARSWPEAAAKYERALLELNRGLPAVAPHEYADAALRLGSAAFMAGEEKPAHRAFALAARLDPAQKLVAGAAVPGAEAQLQQARLDAEASRRGALEVEARPAGARVSVDGEPRGASPVRVELTAGKHLLRVERAGFYPHADLVEIAPRKTSKQSLTLAATATAAGLNQIIAGASDEVGHGAAGRNVAALAQKFSLERLLIGTVRTSEQTRVSVVLALVDAPGQRVIASRTLMVIADGTDTDQIEAETSNAARKLIAQDSVDEPAAQRKAPEAVPAAATGEAPVAKEPVVPDKKDKKTPTSLKGKTGTEDWD